MNMTNQVTPWGSLTNTATGSTWMTDPNGKRVEVPTYTATTTLSPSQQAIFDQTQAAELNLANIANEQSARVGDLLNNPFEYSNQDAENWAYDLASQRILPQQQQNQKALENQLINSGIRRGTSAWDSEMARLTNANTDQMNQLALQGRSQGFNEQLALRNQPLNEIIGLMSGTQIQNPNATFAQTPQSQVAGVDYSGLVNQNYQNRLSAYNAQTGALGGLFGSAASAFMKSDRRVKKNITRVGYTDAGQPVYTYQYLEGGPYLMGVMAQESPENAVMTDPSSGVMMVNYAEIK